MASLERQRVLRRCRHLLDAWRSQRLQSLEACIAVLLQDEARGAEAQADATAGMVMEERIDRLFASLNAEALRFQSDYYSERRYLEALDRRRLPGVG